MNKYCVYLLHDKNGDVFYVGSGTEKRAKSLSAFTRNKAYTNKYAELDGEIYSLIVYRFLTKQKSIELEQKLFDLYNTQCELLNKNRPSKTKDMDFDHFNQILYYDETSPSGLRYKINVDIQLKNNTVRRVSIGDVAGTLNEAGYYIVNRKGSLFLAHRIIWLLHYGVISTQLVIDHIDRNKSNNVITNLRQVSQKENLINVIKQNTSPYGAGIMHDKIRNRFRSYVTVDGKQIARSFSIAVHGFNGALSKAITARQKLLTLYCTSYN